MCKEYSSQHHHHHHHHHIIKRIDNENKNQTTTVLLNYDDDDAIYQNESIQQGIFDWRISNFNIKNGDNGLQNHETKKFFFLIYSGKIKVKKHVQNRKKSCRSIDYPTTTTTFTIKENNVDVYFFI